MPLSLLAKIEEDQEKKRRAGQLTLENLSIRQWSQLGTPAPGMGEFLNPAGTAFQRAKEDDPTLRPSNFFESIMRGLEPGGGGGGGAFGPQPEPFPGPLAPGVTPFDVQQGLQEFGSQPFDIHQDPFRLAQDTIFPEDFGFQPPTPPPPQILPGIGGAPEFQSLLSQGADPKIAQLMGLNVGPFGIPPQVAQQQAQFLQGQPDAKSRFEDFLRFEGGNISPTQGPLGAQFGQEGILDSLLAFFTVPPLPEIVAERAAEVPIIGPGLEQAAKTPLAGFAAFGAGALGPASRAVSGGLLRSLGIEAAAEAGFIGGRSFTDPIDNPLLREGLPVLAGFGAAAAAPAIAGVAPKVIRAGARQLDEFGQSPLGRTLGSEAGGGKIPGGAGDDFLPPIGRELDEGADAVKAIDEVGAAQPPPDVPRGLIATLSPEAAEGDVVLKLTELVEQARSLRPAERAARRRVLAERFAASRASMEAAEPGKARLGAGLGELKGKLPAARFEAPEQFFGEDELVELYERAYARFRDPLNPLSSSGAPESTNVLLALEKVMAGAVPADFELDLLQSVFGPELIAAIRKHRSLGAKAWEEFMGALGAQRTMLTVYDLSAALRQAGPAIGQKEWWGNLPTMVRLYASRNFADAMDESIRLHPKFNQAVDDGFRMTTPGQATTLATREESFMIPSERTFVGSLIRKIPGVSASERAHSGFLTKVRFDMYANNIDRVQDGENLMNFIYDITGRGTLGPLNSQAPLISALMFSGRLQSSRVRLPFNLLNGDPVIRKMAARNLVAFVGAATSILTALQMTGVAGVEKGPLEFKDKKKFGPISVPTSFDIDLNPVSADWGKIKIGPTTIDLWAGYQPLARFMMNVAVGERKGRPTLAYPGGVTSDVDFLRSVATLARNKASPAAGAVVDTLRGVNAIGEDVDFTSPGGIKTEAFNRFVPLVVQDIVDAVREAGWAQGLAALPAIPGAGVQTYRTFAERRDDARNEVFEARKANGEAPYTDYATLAELVEQDPRALSRLDDDLAVQEILSTARASDESTSLERVRQEFQEIQLIDDGRLINWFAALAQGGDPDVMGMSPVVWADAVDEHQADLFSRSDEIMRDIEFPEVDAPEDSVREVVDNYFSVKLADYTDPATGERNWTDFIAAQDAALAPLGSDTADIKNWIKENFETPFITELRNLADGIDTVRTRAGKTYFDLDAGGDRTDFRKAHPDVDAVLWLTGSGTTTLRSFAAANEAADWLNNEGLQPPMDARRLWNAVKPK